MEMPPYRCCNYYSKGQPNCRAAAVYVVSIDCDGIPGNTGVLSAFRCEAHKQDGSVRAAIPYHAWWLREVLGLKEAQTEWDLT